MKALFLAELSPLGLCVPTDSPSTVSESGDSKAEERCHLCSAIISVSALDNYKLEVRRIIGKGGQIHYWANWKPTLKSLVTLKDAELSARTRGKPAD